MHNKSNMGTTLSSQEALEANKSGANNSDEYKLTNLDVIHIQSILLGLHNSISELHNKQGELKKLISVQNNLFAQQNEIVKSLANAVSSMAKEGESSEEESSHKDAHLSSPSAAEMPQLELPPSDEMSDESSVSDVLLDTAIPVEGTPEKDCSGSESSISSIPMPQETRTNAEEKQIVTTGGKLSHSCGDGLHRLFKLDVTVMIAKLNEHTLEETVTDLQNLLSKGPVGQASQYEMMLDAILQCIYDEPARSSITARLIQKTSTKLTLDEHFNLQKACTASLEKCMKMCQEIQNETENLRRSAFTTDKTKSELIMSKFNAKCTQRNRWMHGMSRFALELFKANALSIKPILDLGDELLENAFAGDDISATCFHSLFRKLHDISEVTETEKQWMEKVYLSAEKLSENKKLSLATRLAFAELSELKTGWK